jgi:hypothetical protein
MVKEKIRQKVKGFKHSPEAIEKIRAAALRQWSNKVPPTLRAKGDANGI